MELHNKCFLGSSDLSKMQESEGVEVETSTVKDEIILLQRDLQNQKEKIEHLETSFSRLINIFNEKITDLYGEVNHIKKHGDYSNEVQREKIIMRNYFTL